MRSLSDASADSSSKRRLRRRPSRRTPRSAFARSPPPSHMTSLVTARANCRVTTGNRSERTHARVERVMASAVSTSSRVFVAALASAAVSADTAFAKPVATAQTLERSSTPSSTIRAPSSTIFDGSYYDPNHPGCPRAIAPALKGGVTISGLDPIPFERGRGCRGVKKTSAVASTKFNAWSIPAEVNGDEIIIDFNAKDGSGEKVTGRKVPEGIALPDGTTWTLKSLDKADAWTPR